MGATVVHVIVSLVHGGAERTLTRIVPDGGTDDHGTRHIVVTLRDGGAFRPALDARRVRVISLGMRPGPSALLGWARLVRVLREQRPDLVLTWLYHADLLGTLAAPFARSPRLVWNLRGTAKVAGGSPWHTRLIVRVLALLSRRPWAVAANSQAGRAAHEAIGYRPRRWCYLPNGFDTEVWRPEAQDRADVRRELGLQEEVAVVMVARTHHQKDHPTLLAAWRQVAARCPGRARLVLVGPGTDQLPIDGASEDSIIALGSREDVPRLLRGCDIAVLSSAYGEGLPNVVGEAMATGLPAVVTDVGDGARLVAATGWVVPPADPDALAAALQAAITAPAAERRRRGAAARSLIADHWSLEATHQAYRRLVDAR